MNTGPSLLRLNNPIRPYAWGSRHALTDLLGIPNPSEQPQAELWMGAHEVAPSTVAWPAEGTSLREAVVREPDRLLGREVSDRFAAQLPFLFKVLAVDAPLSLQSHPSMEQARMGFVAEEALGIARDSSRRNYKDALHKPELVCALTRFEALVGFRSPVETAALLRAVQLPELEKVAVELERAPSAETVLALLRRWLELPAEPLRPLVASVAEGCRGLAQSGGAWAREAAWIERLATSYPGDRGVLAALLLELLALEPGQAVFVPAGRLHAYLGGCALEVMANSDNVLRGGLTPKHVDVPELLRVLAPQLGAPPLATLDEEEAESRYRSPAEEFELSRLVVSGRGASLEVAGPEIVLCTAGQLSLRSGAERQGLERGHSLFVAAAAGRYELSGDGVLYRVRVPVARP